MNNRDLALCSALFICTLAAAAPASAQAFDVLIRNGRVLDGSGNPYFIADIGIRGDRIVAMGRLKGASATRTIDAQGLYVTPGFIDLHSHAPSGLASDNLDLRKAHNLISQGITSVVSGADGRNAVWPVSAEKAAYEKLGIAQNAVLMVGHSTVRQKVMGEDHEREATPQEIAQMQQLVRQGMEEGAWGLGAGPEYRPARFSSPQEIIELARVVADYDGFYFSHQRSEAALPMWALASIVEGRPVDGIQALEETINIAKETGIRVVASHIKTRGRASWGGSYGEIFLINKARDEGLQVYADQYPYNTGGGLRAMMPGWAFAPPGFDRRGGQDDPRLRDPKVREKPCDNLRANLANPVTRKLIDQDIDYLVKYWSGPDTHIIVVSPDPALIGKNLAEVAKSRGENYVQTVVHYSLQGCAQPGGGFRMRVHSMNELDVENFMRQEWTATSSDAGIEPPGQPPQPGDHERSYGGFVRKISKYVKDRGVITLPFAIRAASGLPAEIIGVKDRGYLREGYKADIVVFDYAALQDRATVMKPNLYSEGIKHVLVNGKLALDEGRLTGALSGVVIDRRPIPRM